MAADNARLASMPNTTPSRTNDTFSHRLSVLTTGPQRDALIRGLRGIEKESLRVTHDGKLAMTPHSRALGSALTHPSLTTDYSEALLELITPAEHDVAITLEKLDTLHRFVYAELGDEILWNNSMPGLLPETDEGIPIAHYGTSNIGKLKYVYRIGLALRYGRTMQCIAGIHYNYSLNEEVWRVLHADQQSTANAVDFQSDRYLALIRNFRRTNWLLMYLFGASPALDRRFLRDRQHTLETFDADTLYRPYATSLRMSDLGYSNTTAQAALQADYNTLPGYLDALAKAVSQPYPAYEAIGTQRDGEWVQINTNVLQIENEFYSTIRPKRVTHPGERPLHALAARQRFELGWQLLPARLQIGDDPVHRRRQRPQSLGHAAQTASQLAAGRVSVPLPFPLRRCHACLNGGNPIEQRNQCRKPPVHRLCRRTVAIAQRDSLRVQVDLLAVTLAQHPFEMFGGSRHGDFSSASRRDLISASFSKVSRCQRRLAICHWAHAATGSSPLELATSR